MKVIYKRTGAERDIVGNKLKVERKPDGLYLNDEFFTECSADAYIKAFVWAEKIHKLISDINVRVKEVHDLVSKSYVVIKGKCYNCADGITCIDSADGNSDAIAGVRKSFNEASHSTKDEKGALDALKIIGCDVNSMIKLELGNGFVVVQGGAYEVKSSGTVYVSGMVMSVEKALAVLYNDRLNKKQELSKRDVAEEFKAYYNAVNSAKAKPKKEPSMVFAIMAQGSGGRKFVKAIYEQRGGYALTDNLSNARRFKSEDEVHAAMDFLVPIGLQKGVSFIYDVVSA